MEISDNHFVSLLDIDQIFAEEISWEPGQRLGVNYTQAQAEQLPVTIQSRSVHVQQSSMGVLAITGVVWDAGLYMVDFLSWLCSNQRPLLQCDDMELQRAFFDETPFQLKEVIDLGCGTGIHLLN